MKKWKRLSAYITLFIISGILYMIMCAASGIGSGHSDTVLKWDAIGEYINFYAYLRDIITGTSNEVFYTLSMMPGGGNALIVAWHLISPYNIVFLLWGKDGLPVAYYIIELLKVSTCSVTMAFLLSNQLKREEKEVDKRKLLIIVICSLSYAFCGFVTAYVHDIFWLDGVLILPVIIDGIYEIVQGHKSVHYFVGLSYAIITNFYIGFMTCIICALFYLYLVIKRKQITSIFHFLISSILAAGTSSLVLFPVMYQVFLSKMSNKNEKFFSMTMFAREMLIIVGCIGIFLLTVHFLNCNRFVIRFNNLYRKIIDLGVISIEVVVLKKVFDVLAWKGDALLKTYCMPLKFLIGSYNYLESDTSDLMNIYIGVGLIIVFILWILDYRVNFRDKIIDLSAIIVLTCMMFFKHVNFVMHGFTHPLGNFYRWSYMFSLFIIMIVAKYMFGLEEYRERLTIRGIINNNGSFCALIGILVSAIFAAHYYVKEGFVFVTATIILLNSILIGIYFLVYLHIRYKKKGYLLFTIVIFFELTINGVMSTDGYDYLKYDEYRSYIQTSKSIMNDIYSDESDGIFRTEWSFRPEWYYIAGYNSVYHHSSAYTRGNLDFMTLFGMGGSEAMGGQRCNNKFDLSSEKASFWGIKYLLTEDMLTIADYRLLNTYHDSYTDKELYLYRNELAMPLCFRIDNQLAEQNWNDPSDISIEKTVREYKKRYGDIGLKNIGISKYSAKLEADENERALITIPYDKGWKVLVNGKKINPQRAFGYLLSVQLENGENEISLQYWPPFMMLGMIITILSVILYVCYMLFEKKVC